MRRRPRRHRVVAVVLYLALLAWSLTTVAAAAGRQSLSVVCSSIEELCRAWAGAYAQRTGTEVLMVRLSSGEALARLSRPGGLGEFDVWHGGPADTYEVAQQRGLLTPYVPLGAAQIPAAYRATDGSWTGVYLGVLGFCSNRAVLGRLGVPVPTSWDDLTRPELARQLSAPNPLTSGTGYTIVWTQRLRLGSDEAAIDYLRRLDAQVLQYTSSGLAPARVAGRGEVAVALTFSQHCLQAAREGHDDLVVSYPREGTGFEIGSVALLGRAPHGAAARAYLDFSVSREAQELGARSSARQLPTRDDLPADPGLGGSARLLPYAPREAARHRAELSARVAAVMHR